MRGSGFRGRVVIAAGQLGLILSLSCGGPSPEPWHTRELTAEFTADMADEIRSFADYLRLEDRLFEQLDEEIYANTETGAAHALVRYSSGSASDPRNRQPDWNRSFEMAADDPVGGVLLLHGMSDSPYSLRALGETFGRRGYQVLGLRLPGHGTAPSGLTSLRWEDMAAAVRLGMKHLGSEVGVKPIHVVGYSTGATLALNYALDALDGESSPAPASLVLVSPAISVHRAAALAPWKDALAVVPGLQRLAWLSILPEFDPYKYNSFATNAGTQVYRLTRSVSARIAARAGSGPILDFPPTLALKSTVDATVTTDAVVHNLLEHLAPHRHELVLFDINRFALKSTLLVSDPGPLTERLMRDATLPFAIDFVTNESRESRAVVARRKPPFSGEVSEVVPLGLAWPTGVISLSHVALPFPPEDPLYGQRAPGNEDAFFLGQMAIQGELGLFVLSSDWLLRLRHNPFYDYLEARVLEWTDGVGRD